jgi:TolB-like protein
MNCSASQYGTLLLLLLSLFLASCGPGMGLSLGHLEHDQRHTDRWSALDSQRLSRTMVNEMLVYPWYDEFVQEYRREPVVMVYGVRDFSAEPIEIDHFIDELQQALLQTGQLFLVTPMRTQLQPDAFARDDTVQAMGEEYGADFVLTGEVNAVIDEREEHRVVTYQVELRLLRVADGQAVWLGSERIEKQQPRHSG